MIDPDDFLDFLTRQGVVFFSGVPDSLLKELCQAILVNPQVAGHQTACNEGAAVGIAMGYHLATNTLPAIYLQNSGLGNVVNPVCSLAANVVYGIPLLLIVGWRGEILPDGEQVSDEPQHRLQGQVTLAQLDVMNIPWCIIDGENEIPCQQIRGLLDKARAEKHPVALVIRRKTFSPHRHPAIPAPTNPYPLREGIVEACLKLLPQAVPVISTTGMLSRELYELREKRHETHERDFLTVGGMGLASQIALGICYGQPQRKVVCLDGDGAALMHMGGLTNCAQSRSLIHIVINNGAHESVGGQATAASGLDLALIAAASGYRQVNVALTLGQFQDALRAALAGDDSQFIEVKCRPGHRSELGRPAATPQENRHQFMSFLATSTEQSTRAREEGYV
ncbi:phosphonopyruvate decarboxylase [Vagococcus sp. WN89Y]|uniref:phosphonopyruvate decarboxylase n=1 Tax=Vagococcus sp. WN89Y TaxID=3457258 RepID=UPI003FCE88D1